MKSSARASQRRQNKDAGILYSSESIQEFAKSKNRNPKSLGESKLTDISEEQFSAFCMPCGCFVGRIRYLFKATMNTRQALPFDQHYLEFPTPLSDIDAPPIRKNPRHDNEVHQVHRCQELSDTFNCNHKPEHVCEDVTNCSAFRSIEKSRAVFSSDNAIFACNGNPKKKSRRFGRKKGRGSRWWGKLNKNGTDKCSMLAHRRSRQITFCHHHDQFTKPIHRFHRCPNDAVMGYRLKYHLCDHTAGNILRKHPDGCHFGAHRVVIIEWIQHGGSFTDRSGLKQTLLSAEETYEPPLFVPQSTRQQGMCPLGHQELF